MAKKKTTKKTVKKKTTDDQPELPSVETSPIGDKPVAETSDTPVEAEDTEKTEVEAPTTESKPSVDVHIPPIEPKTSALICKVEVPLAPITPHGYMTDQIDMRGGRLTRKQRENLKRLTRGLDDAGAKLENGKAIVYPIDAVRFVLERLG